MREQLGKLTASDNVNALFKYISYDKVYNDTVSTVIQNQEVVAIEEEAAQKLESLVVEEAIAHIPETTEPEVDPKAVAVEEAQEAEKPEQTEAVQPAPSDDAATNSDDSAKNDAGENDTATADDVATNEPTTLPLPVPIDEAVSVGRFSEGLLGKDLASQLGRDAGSITKHNKKGDLPQWSKELDPDGIAWERRGKLYYPVNEDSAKIGI